MSNNPAYLQYSQNKPHINSINPNVIDNWKRSNQGRYNSNGKLIRPYSMSESEINEIISTLIPIKISYQLLNNKVKIQPRIFTDYRNYFRTTPMRNHPRQMETHIPYDEKFGNENMNIVLGIWYCSFNREYIAMPIGQRKEKTRKINNKGIEQLDLIPKRFVEKQKLTDIIASTFPLYEQMKEIKIYVPSEIIVPQEV